MENSNRELLPLMVLHCSLLLPGDITAAEVAKSGKPAQTSTLDTTYRSVTQLQLRINGKPSAYTTTAGSLSFKTDLLYQLLNDEVFESWNWRSVLQGFVEAIADLK